MEKYNLKNDVTVFYVTAASFPDGIMAAHEKMHALLPATDKRLFYGISRPNEKGIITYKVGVEEQFEGEGKKFGCEIMKLDKGDYLSIVIDDYTKHIEEIAKAFQNLIHQPQIDPRAYCVEMYETDNRVRCMVRLKN